MGATPNPGGMVMGPAGQHCSALLRLPHDVVAIWKHFVAGGAHVF